MSVQKSAHEVRAYPVEVITQSTTRIELSIKSCVEAAERARDTYNEATRMVHMVDKYVVWWVIITSVLSSSLVATIIVWSIRR